MKLVPSLIVAALVVPAVQAGQGLLVNITPEMGQFEAKINGCLLYTSDAADDTQFV